MKKVILLLLPALFLTKLSSFSQVPGISSFSPVTGPIGLTVTIKGKNFNVNVSSNIVFFGATQAKVTGGNDTSLSVVVPAGATYNYITVTNTANFLTAYSNKPFMATFACGRNIDSNSFVPRVDSFCGSSPSDISIADVDGDNKSDIIVITTSSDRLSVFRNIGTNGKIAFAPRVDFSISRPTDFYVSDLNGDGKQDIAIVNGYNNVVSVFKNTSTIGVISFAAKLTFVTGSQPVALCIHDLDGDGKPDIVVANDSASTMSILKNNGTAGTISFANKSDKSTGSNPLSVDIGDLDGDGKPEIVVGNYGSTTMSVFRNTSTVGTISFATRVNFTTGAEPRCLRIADLNDDGKPEVTLANGNMLLVSILKNKCTTGTILFDTKVDYPSEKFPTNIAIADLNGDGKPEVVCSNGTSQTLSIFGNNTSGGAISFASRVNLMTDAGAYKIAIGDLNDDGKPDVVCTNFNGLTVSFFKNQIDDTPPSTPVITPNGATLTSSSITGNQWYFNGNIIPGAIAQTYTATKNGSYTVIVKINGNCSSGVSVPYTVSGLNTDNLNAHKDGIIAYPNPVNEVLNIDLKGEERYLIMKLFDMVGKEVLNTSIQGTLDMSKIPSGIYLLELSSYTEKSCIRIIKQ